MSHHENGTLHSERGQRWGRRARAGVCLGALVAAGAAACSVANIGAADNPPAINLRCELFGFNASAEKWNTTPLHGSQLPADYPTGSVDFQILNTNTSDSQPLDLTGQIAADNDGSYYLYYPGASPTDPAAGIRKDHAADPNARGGPCGGGF